MISRYLGPERRRAKRIRATFIVIYRVGSPLQVRLVVGNIDINAIMLNLSEGGMAILTNYDIPVSTALSMKFILINENAVLDKERVRPMQINAEVRYNIAGERDERRLGVCFTKISETDRHAIVNFMRKMAAIPRGESNQVSRVQ